MRICKECVFASEQSKQFGLSPILLIGFRRTPDLLPEILSEEGLIGEVEHIGDLLHGIFAAFEQGFRLENDEVGDPVAGKAAAYPANDLRQIFGRHTQHIGIIGYTALLYVAFPYFVHKLRVEFLLPAAFHFRFFIAGIGSEQIFVAIIDQHLRISEQRNGLSVSAIFAFINR